MKLPEHVKCSVTLSRFLCAATQSLKDYNFYKAEQDRFEKLISDYEHKLELETLGYKERAKIATALTDALQKRRTAKDAVELLTPFADWISSVDTTKPGVGGYYALNILREILGRCRKKEEWMEKRTYKFKVLKAPNIPNKVADA